jgi:hypothetical protein
LYELNFYGRLGSSPHTDTATIYYSTDNINWNPIATPVDDTSCTLREVLNFSSGTTVYVSMRNSSGTTPIGYNAATGNTCPANSNVYCEGVSVFSVIMNGNKDIALTANVSGGAGIFVVC